MLTAKCDRCGGQLWNGDARATDLLKAEYPLRDICDKCDRQIVLRQSIAKQAFLENSSEAEIYRQMLNNYGIEVND